MGDLVDDQRFDRPVHVRLGSGAKIKIIQSTKEAADCLTEYRWPRGTGAKHRLARKACLDALSGLKKAAVARRAFEAAAIESDILVSNLTIGAALLANE
jgi:hypothetical protein